MTAPQKDAAAKDIIDAMNASDVSVFAIMDYWCFDGYILVRDYLQLHPEIGRKTILPGIELRLEAPTDFRLNTHVVFDDATSSDALNHFLANLRIGGHQGRPPSRESFIAVAKGYDDGKLRHHGRKPEDRTDADKMCLLGMETVLVTRESLDVALRLIGEDHYLIIQPYDTSDGLEDLDWKRHPYSDSVLMKMAHVFETRDDIHVRLFLGQGHPTKPNVGREFLQNLGGFPKPVVSGSDAHQLSDYGKYPSDRITWLKAQPTFAGLRQVCHEPAARCFIGLYPDKLEHVRKNPTKYMGRISITKTRPHTEHWFDGIDVRLNPGLIAIIGNKGSGKSALADILALAGNTHCAQMEFLNSTRFRQGANKSGHFTATLHWLDGSAVPVVLDQDGNRDQPERVRYLPQQYIESLCNEIAAGNEANFERELKKVIFSHVPEQDRLRKPDLDTLIEYRVEGHRTAIKQHQATLASLNQEVVAAERELSDEILNSYRTALALKEAELEAHDRIKPTEIPAPREQDQDPESKQKIEALAAAQGKWKGLVSDFEKLREERLSLVARQAQLGRLSAHLDNLEASFQNFLRDRANEFQEAGFDLKQIVALNVNRTSLSAEIEATEKRLGEIAATVDGSDTVQGLEALIAHVNEEVAAIQATLDAPQKLHQAYLRELAEWDERRKDILGAADKPNTIEFLKTRLSEATTLIPARLEEARIERSKLVRAIHAELTQVRGVYQTLYKPVQDIAAQGSFTRETLHLDFDAFLSCVGFDATFFDFVHRNRTGNFYGEREGSQYLQQLLKKYDFNKADDVVAFQDALMTALTTVMRDGNPKSVSIQSQLKDRKKLADLYDFIFGIQYIEPRYTLKLGGKDISQLSPGEKGALLLVFYLLLDPAEIPIIIDQPEQNLDNESVVKLLVDCIRHARTRRQVVIVTHNPNLAVVCDADQIIYSRIDKAGLQAVSYEGGAIEDRPTNKVTVDVLEGTYRAFDNRRRKYHPPDPETDIVGDAVPEAIPRAANEDSVEAPASSVSGEENT